MIKYTIDDIKSGKLHVGMRVNENQLSKIHGIWFKLDNIETPYGFTRVGDITEISFTPLKGFWDIIHNKEKTDKDEEDEIDLDDLSDEEKELLGLDDIEEDDILSELQAVGLDTEDDEDDDIAGEIDKILGGK